MEEVVVTGEYDPNYHGYAPSGLTQRGFTVNPLRGNDDEILRYVYVATDANGNETLVVSPDYFARGGDSYGLSGEDLANFLANYQLGNDAYSTAGVGVEFPDGFNPFDFRSNATQIDNFEGFDSSTDESDIEKPDYTETPDTPIDLTQPEIDIEIEFDPQAPEFDFSLEFEELPKEIQEQIKQVYDSAYQQAAGGGGGGGGATSGEAATAANQAVKAFIDSQGLSNSSTSTVDPLGNTTSTTTTTTTGSTTSTGVDPAGNTTTTTTNTDGSTSTTTTNTDGTTSTTSTDSEGNTTTETDSDSDGISDSQDNDIDGDGVPNNEDADLEDPSIFEDTTQSRLDSDGDGLFDDEDPFPNDPLNGETFSIDSKEGNDDDKGEDTGKGAEGIPTTDLVTKIAPLSSVIPSDETSLIVDPVDAFGGTDGGTGGGTGGDVDALPPEGVIQTTPPTPPKPPTPPADDDGIFIDPEDAFGGGDDIGDGGGNGGGGTDGGVDGVDGVDDGGGDDEGGGDDGGVDDTGGTDGGTDTGEGDGDGSGSGGGTGTGTGGGSGEGDGTGEGEGSGSGTGGGLGGRGTGMFTGGKSAGFDPQSFMASISFAPELLTPFMPQNSKDYLAELLARLQK